MPRPSIITIAVGIFASLSLTHARAEPVRAALIIGNATYSTIPGIPGCARSANSVAAALRALGFQVTERQDASTGGVDAGISEFSQHLAGGATGFVYVCGYASDFNDRTFVLPTTARIDRPSDVLTQGLLAKSMLASMSRDPATLGVVVFDLVPKPDAPAKLGLDALAALPVPDAVAIVAASEAATGEGPTPLATALVAALAGPEVHTDALLASVRVALANAAMSIHAPVHPGLLAGSPPVANVPVATPPVPAAAATPKPPPSTTASAPVPSPSAASSKQLPDEARMTEADRRDVQSALVRLGYYGSPVDGLFGPETRAAIRRYQHEIGGEMTGLLTAAEATRLVNTH